MKISIKKKIYDGDDVYRLYDWLMESIPEEEGVEVTLTLSAKEPEPEIWDGNISDMSGIDMIAEWLPEAVTSAAKAKHQAGEHGYHIHVAVEMGEDTDPT